MTEPAEDNVPAVGGPLPPFEGTTARGTAVSREALLGHPAIVYFYPKAGSPGCSMESREFARLHEQFASAGARVVGVSVDPPDAQQRFQESCQLPFDLVADANAAISRRFGVLGALRLARRTTFVVDAEGTVVRVIRSWRPREHARAALAAVLASTPAPPAGPAGAAARPPR
jgi:thioredoxin-dependent peroxiredoxin